MIVESAVLFYSEMRGNGTLEPDHNFKKRKCHVRRTNFLQALKWRQRDEDFSYWRDEIFWDPYGGGTDSERA